MEIVDPPFLALLLHSVMATKVSETQSLSPHPVCRVCSWRTYVLAFKSILSIVSSLSLIRCGKAECVVHMAAGWLPSICSLPWFPFGALRFREHRLHVLFHILLCLLWALFYIHSWMLRLPRLARLSKVWSTLPQPHLLQLCPRLSPFATFLFSLLTVSWVRWGGAQHFHQASLWIKHAKVLTELNTSL